MPVVWLICPDAGLRELLQRCLRDGEGLEVRLKPCACDAVLFGAHHSPSSGECAAAGWCAERGAVSVYRVRAGCIKRCI
jgi:hypothetical protein